MCNIPRVVWMASLVWLVLLLSLWWWHPSPCTPHALCVDCAPGAMCFLDAPGAPAFVQVVVPQHETWTLGGTCKVVCE